MCRMTIKTLNRALKKNYVTLSGDEGFYNDQVFLMMTRLNVSNTSPTPSEVEIMQEHLTEKGIEFVYSMVEKFKNRK